MTDATLDHLANWSRTATMTDAAGFALYVAMLDGIRSDDSILDGNPDWPTVAYRIGGIAGYDAR